MKNTRKIYTFGVGASGMICSDLYFKLSQISKNILCHTDSHIQLASLGSAIPENLIIGMSYSAQTKEVTSAFEIANSRGIPTVSITSLGKQSTGFPQYV